MERINMAACVNLSSQSVNSTCRTCLCDLKTTDENSSEHLTDQSMCYTLDDALIMDNESFTPLREVLNDMCQVNISSSCHDDNLSRAICSECTDNIRTMFVFRRQCRLAEKFLQDATEAAMMEAKNAGKRIVENLTKPDLRFKTRQVVIEEIVLDDNGVLIITENEEGKPEKHPGRTEEAAVRRELPPQCQRNINGGTNSSNKNDEDDVKLRCDRCTKTFRRRDNLARHQAREHDDTYVCEVCNKRFPRRRYLTIHKKIHRMSYEREFRCRYCLKSFNQRHHLQNHERVHTGHRPYLCSECGEAFRQRHTLTLHMRRHSPRRPFHCDTCGRGFTAKALLRAHLKHGHATNKAKTTTDTAKAKNGRGDQDGSTKRYVCDDCGKTFARKISLEGHMNRIHQKWDDGGTVTQTKRNRTETAVNGKPASGCYKCDECHLTFKTRLQLRDHHRQTEHVYRHSCVICNEGFVSQSDLLEHITHSHDVDMVN